MVTVLGPREAKSNALGIINTTSTSGSWTSGLSPFYLGPIELYGGHVSKNFENAWQFCKVYEEDTDEKGEPTQKYWDWALAGWADERAHRYPKGKGRKPLYSLWDSKHLSYIEARKQIYIPLYSKAVKQTSAYQQLTLVHSLEDNLTLWDFDGYDHRKLGMSYDDVINLEKKKCGHGFVLAMMLEGYL